MTINPSGFETTFTLGELRRIRGLDLAPVPVPEQDDELSTDDSEVVS